MRVLTWYSDYIALLSFTRLFFRSITCRLVENIHKNCAALNIHRGNREFVGMRVFVAITFTRKVGCWRLRLISRLDPVRRWRRYRYEIKLHRTPATLMVTLRGRFALRCRDGD